jgi:hypothetical protein
VAKSFWPQLNVLLGDVDQEEASLDQFGESFNLGPFGDSFNLSPFGDSVNLGAS